MLLLEAVWQFREPQCNSNKNAKTHEKDWLASLSNHEGDGNEFSNFIPSRRLIQCTSTDKPEADSALIPRPPPPNLLLSLHKCSVLWILTLSEATRKGMESQKKDFRSHLGVDLGTSRTEGTNENQVFLPAQEANHFLQQFCL